MNRALTLLVVPIGVAGVALVWGRAELPAVALALVAGGLGGALLGVWRRGGARRATPPRAELRALARRLVTMGDALQEVSRENLQQRGGWDRALFGDVLARVEAETRGFQAALGAYLVAPGPRRPDLVAALLAVDRLSATYTSWTRLFPPRRQDQSMFVLGLLHDLSDKVEHAIRLLGEAVA